MDNMFTGVGNVLEEHAFFLVNIHVYIIILKLYSLLTDQVARA